MILAGYGVKNMSNEIISTMYANVVVKSAAGLILGYYDADCGIVYINGRINGITASDAEIAHDIISAFFSSGVAA